MFKYNLISFFRNMKKHPGLYVANIVGLTVAMLVVVIVYVYSAKELSADRFHTNFNNIYRLTNKWSGSSETNVTTVSPMGSFLSENCPEISNFTRLLTIYKSASVSSEEKEYKNQSVTYVDEGFFEMFSFPLEVGDYKQLFSSSNTIVISKEYALKLFGRINPIGKKLSIVAQPEEKAQNYTIVGILKYYPENSTLTPEIVTNINVRLSKYKEDWGARTAQLFVQKEIQVNKGLLEEKVNDLIHKKRSQIFKSESNEIYHLQPLSDLYLKSADVGDWLPKGDYTLIRILMLAGLIVMVISSINYVILNLGFYIKKSTQLKIHTTLGASRSLLLKKFIDNAVLMALISLVLALILYPLFYKMISAVWDIRYSIFSLDDIKIWVAVVLVIILVGAINGLMQYVIIDKFLIKRFIARKQHLFTGLIQVQLIMFIVAIVGVVVIHNQLNYMRSADKGFDAEHTYNLGFMGYDMMDQFKNEFESYAYVNSMSVGECLYKPVYEHETFMVKDSKVEVQVQSINGDHNYLEANGIQLIEGVNLNREKVLRQGQEFNHSGLIPDVLVNEAFVKQAGLVNPVGTILQHNDVMNYRIAGVFKNVRNLPLYMPENPMLIAYNLSTSVTALNVSIAGGYEKAFMDAAISFYKKRNMGDYLEFLIWHYNFDQEYQKELNLKLFINILTFIILFILLIGIIGLNLHITEIKTKEIGIRKVNGAKISEILTMLNKDFIKWVAIAFVIATPIAWFAMNKWLENFAYKTNLSWWIFALAGLLALGIALLTVSYQSWKAAVKNPVEALRYE